MKAVLQRVSRACVSVNRQTVGQIGTGLCILLGVEPTDSEPDARWLANKVVNLRIFEDAAGKMNLSLRDIQGEALIISQFTLLADCNTGRRPSFTGAGNPQTAALLYDHFCQAVATLGIKVERGIFQADMLVSLDNMGPATFILETQKS